MSASPDAQNVVVITSASQGIGAGLAKLTSGLLRDGPPDADAPPPLRIGGW
jgi:hypothetical protein